MLRVYQVDLLYLATSGSGNRCEARRSAIKGILGRWARTVNTRHDKPVARMIAHGRESLATVRDAVAGGRDRRGKTIKRKGYRAPTDAELKAARGQAPPLSAAFAADASVVVSW